MKKILYIISKPLDDDLQQALTLPPSADYSTSSILIQKGVESLLKFPFPCFVLENDIGKNDLPGSYSKIQYSDMLRMILESDTVISL